MAMGGLKVGRKKKIDNRKTTVDEKTLRFPPIAHGLKKVELPDLDREALTIEAFERKLQFMAYILNRRLRADLPNDEYWPRNITEFHSWENLELGIYKLGSKSNISPTGKYKTYVEQYHADRPALARAFRDELKIEKEENSALKTSNSALAQQNARLLHSIQALADELFLATGRRINVADFVERRR
ncbi:hypothetical protein [Rhizobium leguminosarum]|uniref:hypothetical protein n=1 Tax=Rhizobium leguminosarum TaxID=384 RepID=UPI001031942E|nr:hypothetical protein [Rhizobium leguminosarum]TAX29828.1 hypothetical protein ELI04_08675 [Rhizobium leguminosarum]